MVEIESKEIICTLIIRNVSYIFQIRGGYICCARQVLCDYLYIILKSVDNLLKNFNVYNARYI